MRLRSLIFALSVASAVAVAFNLPAQEPPHPILSIGSNNGSAGTTILNTWTESQYTNNFTPRQSPRHGSYGMVPPVVSGDTGWSWSSSTPNQITSTPSGTVLPNVSYTIRTTNVLVTSGKTVPIEYYYRAGSTSPSLVFGYINYFKRSHLRGNLMTLAQSYMGSGGTHASRNQAYARRVAIALADWANYVPDYYIGGKNNTGFTHAGTNYVLSSDLQRASDHNGLAHEWADDELLAFDAIYDSPALAQLSVERGYDVREHIKNNLFCNFGDFFRDRVPINIATGSNLSGPYTVLALVARVLNRPDYIDYMDRYLDATVTKKIQRDGTLSEGMGYSIGYINENLAAARNTRNYFLSRPADTADLLAISIRATNYVRVLEYGQNQWRLASLPNGQLPSFGDTPFNNYFSARNTGTSVLLPAYGSVSLGTGSSSGTAVQLNQIYSGDNNHMRSDTTAYVLWAFGNEVLGNVRYHNGTPGRNFTEQILAYNAVTIDRGDMTSPTANTYGTGDLTLYEPGNNGFAVTEIDGQRAYNNRASRYQRIMIMNTVDATRPYVVDVFRVTGGATHDYVWHGSIRYDQTCVPSFPLVTNTATYPMLEGSEVWTEPTSSGSTFPYYGFWRNVSSNLAPGNFQLTYRDVNRTSPRDTKLWMTANPNEYQVYAGRTPVPSRSNGEPANWWVNGLWRPSTIIRRRIPSGTLHDLFVSVIEPMNGGVSTIQSVERVPMSGSALESAALRITFTDGRVDTCVVNLRNPKVAGANTGSQTVSTADGEYVLDGRIGVHMDRPSGPRVWTMNAADFQYAGRRLTTPGTYHSGMIAGETRKLVGGSNDALVTSSALPLGTALRGKHLSLGFGTLSASGITTGLDQLFEIDQVIFTNSQYHVCFTNDHLLEITNGATTVEQVAPLRRFTTSNSFEIATSAYSQQISPLADVAVPPGGSSGPIGFSFGNLGNTSGASLQVLAYSADQVLIPNGSLVIGGSGTSRTLTITPSASQTGSALITVAVTDGSWTNSRSFTAFVTDFALTASPPSRTIVVGGSTSFTADVTATNGFSELVTFGLSGLPAHVGASFNPPSISGAGSSTLNLVATNTVTPGTYPLTLTAISPSLSSTSSVTLVINPVVVTPGWAVWTGGSASNSFWTDAPNWGGSALVAGSSLTFAGTMRLDNTNNTAAGTTYSNIVFASDAASFTLNGNPVTLAGNITNNSAAPQTVALGLSFNASLTFNGVSNTLIVAGGLTNTFGAPGFTTLSLAGEGILHNRLRSTASPGGTNSVVVNQSEADWRLVDNDASLPTTMPWVFSINNGSFTFGAEDSSPVVTLTTPNNSPHDNQVGTVGGATGVFNMASGTLTTSSRFNTATAANATGIINQSGGTFNMGSQFQGANGSNPGQVSIVNLGGGTMNIGSAASPTSPFYVASRGSGTLNLSGTGILSCGRLDLSRNANGNSVSSVGTVNLDGGFLFVTSVTNLSANQQIAGSPSATFNFNGGTLVAKTNASPMFFRGSQVAPITPIQTFVKTGGAIIDDGGYSITIGEPLRHDPVLGTNSDGGLIKLNSGTLTLTGTNTYTGSTIVSNGTLALIGNASIATSPLVEVENGGTLNAAGRNDGTVTWIAGQKLVGNGALNGHVVFATGSTLAPGRVPHSIGGGEGEEEEEGEEGGGGDEEDPVEDVDPVGALTFLQSLTLHAGSTTAMDLNPAGSGTNDVVNVAGAVTYGGTLALSGVSAGLSDTDTFKLFAAAAYNGAFSSITPETPGANLVWNTNTLAVDGTLRIDSIAPPPQPWFASAQFSAGTMVLKGSNGVSGGSYYVLTSTNLSLPISNWTRVLTNLFDENGGFGLTNSIDPDAPQQFYLLQVP